MAIWIIKIDHHTHPLKVCSILYVLVHLMQVVINVWLLILNLILNLILSLIPFIFSHYPISISLSFLISTFLHSLISVSVHSLLLPFPHSPILAFLSSPILTSLRFPILIFPHFLVSIFPHSTISVFPHSPISIYSLPLILSSFNSLHSPLLISLLLLAFEVFLHSLFQLQLAISITIIFSSLLLLPEV